MMIYVVFKPYGDDIEVFTDGKEAYRKAYELNVKAYDGDIDYKVLEFDTEKKEVKKE